MFAPTTLFALLSSLIALPALAAHNQPRRSHQQIAAEYEARRLQELEQRLMPITATTTIVVHETRTQTVWVQPTDQVPFEPSVTDEAVSTTTASASSEPSASASDNVSSSEASASGSAEVSNSAEASGSLTSYSSASSSGSNAPSPSRVSGSGPPRSSPAPTASASEAQSSFTDAGASSSAEPSVSASSASEHPSASITDAASSSRSASNAPTYSRSSGSGEPRPTPTSSSTYLSESSSLSETSLVAESASSSSSDPHETLWSASSSAIISSVTASASSSYSSSAIESSSAVASSTSSASGSSSTLAPLGPRLMNAYYPDWSAWYLAPESVDWSKYDVLDFAFALPTQDGGLQFTQDDSSDLLHRLVASGHANGKRVKLSIGGWTGSAYFSTITASDSLRATFVSNIVNAYHAYKIDGIDIDWEYPGVSGAAGNAVSSSDSANYLRLLQDLRAALPSDALITTATQVWPFAGPDGRPLGDVSGFAAVLDWILVMNYDIWGSSSSPGPNAPLSDACGNSTQPLANAYAAVSSWTSAGMPANKITLGVPAYGYLSGSWASTLRQRRSHFPQPPHKRALASKQLQARADVTVNNGNGGTTDGQVMFYSLLSQGALVADGNGGYTGAGGFTRHWDACSSTPWLKSDSSGQIITYDDTESMSLKGQFAAQAGIRGCNVFSIDGDYTNGGFPLTDAVRSGLGL